MCSRLIFRRSRPQGFKTFIPLQPGTFQMSHEFLNALLVEKRTTRATATTAKTDKATVPIIVVARARHHPNIRPHHLTIPVSHPLGASHSFCGDKGNAAVSDKGTPSRPGPTCMLDIAGNLCLVPGDLRCSKMQLSANRLVWQPEMTFKRRIRYYP